MFPHMGRRGFGLNKHIGSNHMKHEKRENGIERSLDTDKSWCIRRVTEKKKLATTRFDRVTSGL